VSDTAQIEVTPSVVAKRRADRPQQAVRLSGLKEGAGPRAGESALEGAVLALCVASVGCALILSLSQPEQLSAWLTAGSFLPLSVFVLRLIPGIANAPRALRLSLQRTLLGVGVLILLVLLMRLGEGLGVLQVGGVRRMVGVLLGAGLVLIGYFLPARLLPMFRQHLARQDSVRQPIDAAVAGRLLRFVGTGLMIAGTFFGLTWLLAPLAIANLWASAMFAAVTLFVGCRFALLLNQRNR